MKALLIMSVLLLTSCGSKPDGTEEVLVVKSTLECNNVGVCTSDNMTCTRGDYYSNQVDCTVFIKE